MKINPQLFFFNNDQKSRLKELEYENKVEYRTWFVFSIILPLAPFIISVLINLLLKDIYEWGVIFNNGSLPIISYGFITSGIVYLMERIRNKDDVNFQLRERIMAFAVLFLFLNSSIFIFETTINNSLSTKQHIIVFLISVLILIFSLKTSKIMFLLQKKILDKSFDVFMREEASNKHGKNW